MKLTVSIDSGNGKKTNSTQEQIRENVRKAADLWSSGKKKEGAAILCDVFQGESVPDSEYFTPYIGKLGKEYCTLIERLYLLSITDEEDDFDRWELREFMEACGNDDFLSRFTAETIGDRWNDVREKFYDKCPECMFLGGADESYSLKLRSSGVVECIDESMDLGEISGLEYMDGWNRYEGFALVKDDPDSEQKYPPKIQAILKKIKARKRKYFPNLIFPLTEGKNIFDTCTQMQELLDLLDYGYHFADISQYISNHPKLFPEIMEKRKSMFQTLKDQDSDEEAEWEEDEDEDFLSDIQLEDNGKNRKKRSGGKKNKGH